ncbi:MAG: hypothetical protein HPAVJP_2840 [Candidatus Hepatoplasma vulgare]|nr:MAG: hypothetical protein HPAVJP_2840 [Candidatus Hepatoplasma sp.]
MNNKKNKSNRWFLIILILLFFCYILSLLPLFVSIIIVTAVILFLIYLFLIKSNFIKKNNKSKAEKKESKSNKKEITKIIKNREIAKIFDNHLNKINFENFKIVVENPNHQEFQRMGSIIDIFFKEKWINGNFLEGIKNPKYNNNFLNDFSKIKNNVKENKLIENLLESSKHVIFDKKFKQSIGTNLILGTADLIIDDSLIEIKTSLKSKIDINWIYQLLFYTILCESEFNQQKISNIKILNTRAKNIINIPLNDLIYDFYGLKEELFNYFRNN